MRQALLGFILGVCTLVLPFSFPAFIESKILWLGALLGLLPCFVFYQIHQFKISLNPLLFNLYRQTGYGVVFFLLSGVFGAGYAHWQLNLALQTRLDHPVEKIALVKVIGISEGVGDQWRQVVEEVKPVENNATDKKPIRWLLYAPFNGHNQQRQAPPHMQAGQVWQVRVKLKPAHSNASFGTFDVEKWLLQQHISATGTLQSAQPLDAKAQQRYRKNASMIQRGINHLDHERLRIRQHIMQFESPAKGVLLGLLTGDRSLIDAPTTLLYQHMGISHLLAISGPHVLLAALIITWLLRQLLDRVPRFYLVVERRRWLLPVFLLIVMLYAGLAGFDIPAQRTVFMVGLLSIILWCRRQASALLVLGFAAALLLLLDPLVVLSAAFWLSFGAVAILMTLKRPIHQSNLTPDASNHLALEPPTKLYQYRQHILSFVHLQWRLFVLLAPLVLLCFAKISWLAPVVNLLAIPLLSFVVLPLNLLAYALFLISPVLADRVWAFALVLLEWFHAALNQLGAWFPQALQPFHLSNVQLLALFVMLVMVLLAKGILPRWWLIFLLPPVVFPLKNHAPLTVHVLDVGQGLSVLLTTKHHAMLVDTGAKTPHADMGEKVVLPALQAQGIRRLDKLMLTHLDNDHSGGAPTLLKKIPVMQLISNEVFATYPTHLCEAGQSWQWDGVLFKVLAPLPQHQVSNNKIKNDKNESSCVLMVETPATPQVPAQRVLIMGDAGFYTEFLLQQQQIPLNADVLILGHHGSKHSSSSLFLQTVAPQRAVVSAGYLNRYQHPAPVVLARLVEQGIVVDSTIQKGTLSYYLGQNPTLIPSAYRDTKPWLKR